MSKRIAVAESGLHVVFDGNSADYCVIPLDGFAGRKYQLPIRKNKDIKEIEEYIRVCED